MCDLGMNKKGKDVVYSDVCRVAKGPIVQDIFMSTSHKLKLSERREPHIKKMPL